MEKNIRAPIVTVLGHVDHGKTSLLDAIRKTNVATKEVGGITQSIGASKIELQKDSFTSAAGKGITFIDTPGHAAFSKMRGRGAEVADIAVLVVAADDGVKPQTKEALELIKEAKIPFIVAITKTDLPSKNIEGARGQLEKEGVLFEGRGGDTPVVSVSAKEEKGIKELLETIAVVAEVHEIKGDPGGDLEAVVIESSKDKRGTFANMVVRNGTLRIGNLIQAENVGCKIRAIFDSRGVSVKEVLPGEPAQILGFEEIPPVGAKVTNKGSLAGGGVKNEVQKVDKLSEGQIAVILKARSGGSLEALVASLPPNIVVIGGGVGDVNESDVLSAKASNAWIFAFESNVPAGVLKLAKMEGVHIERFEIIYELFQRLEELLKKGQVEVLGKAQVITSFPFNNKKIAGCKVTSGRIVKTDNLILARGEKEIGKVKAISMKKQKTEITEAKGGEEFGIIFEPQLDFEVGDVLISVRK